MSCLPFTFELQHSTHVETTGRKTDKTLAFGFKFIGDRAKHIQRLQDTRKQSVSYYVSPNAVTHESLQTGNLVHLKRKNHIPSHPYIVRAISTKSDDGRYTIVLEPTNHKQDTMIIELEIQQNKLNVNRSFSIPTDKTQLIADTINPSTCSDDSTKIRKHMELNELNKVRDIFIISDEAIADVFDCTDKLLPALI